MSVTSTVTNVVLVGGGGGEEGGRGEKEERRGGRRRRIITDRCSFLSRSHRSIYLALWGSPLSLAVTAIR